VAPLRSNVGALGLMQVNPHVWRGFYAVDGLALSIGYNARAGSEILLHYLRDYAIARGEEDAGGPDALARASYAVYHGGPSHLRRYRQPKIAPGAGGRGSRLPGEVPRGGPAAEAPDGSAECSAGCRPTRTGTSR
jgi:soluble lytic murein transglycosylase-like protein